jgi:hypothetical protein
MYKEMPYKNLKAQSYLYVPKSLGIYRTVLRYEDPSPGRVTRETREVESMTQGCDALRAEVVASQVRA